MPVSDGLDRATAKLFFFSQGPVDFYKVVKFIYKLCLTDDIFLNKALISNFDFGPKFF